MTSPEGDPTEKDNTDARLILHDAVDRFLYTHDKTYAADHPVKDGVRHAVVGTAVGASIVTLEAAVGTTKVVSGVLRAGVEVALSTAETVQERLGGTETIYKLRKDRIRKSF